MDAEVHPSHDMFAADSVYHTMGVGLLVHQHATPSLPIVDAQVATSDYTDPHERPLAYHDHQAGGQLPDPSPVPSRDHEFYDAGTQMFSADFGGTYLPYPIPHESSLLLDHTDTVQATPIVTHETDPSGDVDPSVIIPSCRVGNDNTTGLSMVLPQLGTNNIQSRDPRKRKRATMQDEPSEVNRTRRRTSRHLDPQQAPVRVSISKSDPLHDGS